MAKTRLLLLLIFGLTSCNPGSPEKIAGVPENSFWAGEREYGHWFTVDNIDTSAKTIHCKIYNDKTGKLVSDRKFKLHCYLCEDRIALDNLKNEIRYYDEEKYLNENYIILKTEDADGKSAYFK